MTDTARIRELVAKVLDARQDCPVRIDAGSLLQSACELLETDALALCDRIDALEAENAKYRKVMERCAVIVDRNLYHQHEKIEDVPKLLRAALAAIPSSPASGGEQWRDGVNYGLQAAFLAARGTNSDLCKTPLSAYRNILECLRKLTADNIPDCYRPGPALSSPSSGERAQIVAGEEGRVELNADHPIAVALSTLSPEVQAELDRIFRTTQQYDPKAVIGALASPAQIVAGEWQPISTAPVNTPVRVRLGRGMTIVARLIPDAAMTDAELSCDQWQAEYEGEHPDCWHDGCCWESNADEVMSLQPNAWQPLPPSLTKEPQDHD